MFIGSIFLIIVGTIMIFFPKYWFWIWISGILFAILGWFLFFGEAPASHSTTSWANDVWYPQFINKTEKEVSCVRLDRETHRFVQVPCSER